MYCDIPGSTYAVSTYHFPFVYACVAEAWHLLRALFFDSGNDLFTPSRWTKVAPAMQQWARGLTIHGVLKSSYLGGGVLREDRFARECRVFKSS